MKNSTGRTHKQVIVLRKDLKVRKGKLISQGAHASVKALMSRAVETESHWMIPKGDPDIGPWLLGKFAKIVAGADSEAHLLELEAAALAAGLPCALIRDSGLTEFHGTPTLTGLAIGPAEISKIDPITGGLELL